MMTANFADRGCARTRIPLHATGHDRAGNGILLRVDYERGLGWVATQYDPKMHVIQQSRGSEVASRDVV